MHRKQIKQKHLDTGAEPKQKREPEREKASTATKRMANKGRVEQKVWEEKMLAVQVVACEIDIINILHRMKSWATLTHNICEIVTRFIVVFFLRYFFLVRSLSLACLVWSRFVFSLIATQFILLFLSALLCHCQCVEMKIICSPPPHQFNCVRQRKKKTGDTINVCELFAKKIVIL